MLPIRIFSSREIESTTFTSIKGQGCIKQSKLQDKWLKVDALCLLLVNKKAFFILLQAFYYLLCPSKRALLNRNKSFYFHLLYQSDIDDEMKHKVHELVFVVFWIKHDIFFISLYQVEQVKSISNNLWLFKRRVDPYWLEMGWSPLWL